MRYVTQIFFNLYRNEPIQFDFIICKFIKFQNEYVDFFTQIDRKYLLVILNFNLVVFIFFEILIFNSIKPEIVQVDSIEDHGTKDDG